MLPAVRTGLLENGDRAESGDLVGLMEQRCVAEFNPCVGDEGAGADADDVADGTAALAQKRIERQRAGQAVVPASSGDEKHLGTAECSQQALDRRRICRPARAGSRARGCSGVGGGQTTDRQAEAGSKTGEPGMEGSRQEMEDSRPPCVVDRRNVTSAVAGGGCGWANQAPLFAVADEPVQIGGKPIGLDIEPSGELRT